MSRPLACLLALVLASPAVACMNDGEFPTREREFRSDYRDDTSPGAAPSPLSMASVSLLAGGTVLLLGAFLMPGLTRKPRG